MKAMVVTWRLRELLLKAQISDPQKTVTALAKAAGVSRAQASAWVNSSEVPTIRNASERLAAICDFLECRISDLIVEE